jgi:hypothetical protein
MSSVFTDHEKARIRHHLGYPQVSAISTMIGGVPMAIEPSFMLEGAMDRVMPEAADITREKIATLDTIERQMVGDLELLAVSKIEEITINPDEMKALRVQYDYWADALANDFRVMRNPYDFRTGGGGVVNVRVNH